MKKWQASQTPEARNAPSSAQLSALRLQVQKLKAMLEAPSSPRISDQERKFMTDMAKRLQKNNFAPTEKQSNWVKGLAAKYKV